ncbi:S41 family peptidase [Rubrobacter indicoceani]|uniref:S41 family peptidase n=1 Tax=Rubrobacter indicoceani TaxID=2051957 RepID=UPI000E5ABEC4|nr:S41 family peptidase [Rubrobacter indicoceani]
MSGHFNRADTKNSEKARGRELSWWVRPVVSGAAFALVLITVAGGGYWYGYSQGPASLSAKDEESLRVYAEALNVVRDDYVDQDAVRPTEQTYAAIEGMLDSLGDEGHTRFLTPEERERSQESISGRYVGVGVTIEERDGRVFVVSPVEGSPADRAGVESGDEIIAVNGETVEGQDATAISGRVRGPEGSEIGLTVEKDDGERETYELVRTEISSPVASAARIPGTGTALVRLTSFSGESADQLRGEVQQAVDDGAEKIILDLRDNGGGRLDQARRIANLFLNRGDVIYIRQDADGQRTPAEAEGQPAFPDIPMVVLVNEGSASSSEIVSGALRDNSRATVVGETTFGTGTVLSEFDLSDGSAILLGIAEWLTPNGDFIREEGIVPNVEATLGEEGEQVTPNELEDLSRSEAFERDPQLEAAYEEVAGDG